jgi:succinate dehydrogenase / fumarate reductase iron-sulfur subunit
MSQFYEITLNVLRYDPGNRKTWDQKYNLEVGRILRFTDVFRKINNEHDPTLAWDSSCEHAQCGSCAVKINGKPLLACELLVENAVAQFGTKIFRVEPISIAPVLRDLMVEKIKPYIIQPAQKLDEMEEYQISPRELEHYVDGTRCINCFCCATACISSHQNFLGPNAVLTSIVRLMDPREQAGEERLKTLYSEQGVYRCHTAKACSFVCPKEIDVAHFIALAKEGRFRYKPRK